MSNILIILLIILIFYFTLTILKSNNKNINLSNYIINFSSYMAVLSYHMDKAYEIIYKDRILIYSIEATKLNNNEFRVVARDFLTLVLKMLGPNLINEFIILYGNEETLYFNITEYFNTKFENDEIRKSATDSIIDKENFNDLGVNK